MNPTIKKYLCPLVFVFVTLAFSVATASFYYASLRSLYLFGTDGTAIFVQPGIPYTLSGQSGSEIQFFRYEYSHQAYEFPPSGIPSLNICAVPFGLEIFTGSGNQLPSSPNSVFNSSSKQSTCYSMNVNRQDCVQQSAYIGVKATKDFVIDIVLCMYSFCII
jgi:hypothetical protein